MSKITQYVTASSLGAVLQLAGNSGIATPDGTGTINVVGNGLDVNTVGVSHTLTISVTGGGFVWNEITAASANMAINNGYIANRGTLVTLTLPAVAAQGSTIKVLGKGAGLYQIAQNAGQSINFVSATTTVGGTGSLTATEQFDALEIICTTANTGWTIASSTGNFTVA
jgi:hypothetical protein